MTLRQRTVKEGTREHVRLENLTHLIAYVLQSSLSEYRSAIFTHSPEQQAIAKRVTEEVQAKYFTPKGKKIVTEILEAKQWWDAEDYHQLYLFKNPNGYQCPTHRLHW